MRKSIFILLLVTLVVSPTLARSSRRKRPPPVDPEVKKLTDPLIRQLDDPEFSVREGAMLDLMGMGPEARPALTAAGEHPSPEVRLRVRRILLHYQEVARRKAVGHPGLDDWPMLKREAAHGASAGAGAVRQLPEIEWVRILPGRVGKPFFDAPIIAAGRWIVAVNHEGGVALVSRADGEIVWYRETGEPVFAGAVVSGGRIFVPGKSLTCLDLETGRVHWRWTTDYGVVSTPLVHGGNVYAVEKGEKLVALDPLSGEEQWTVKLAANRSSPVSFGDSILIGTQDGVLRLAADTGKRVWRHRSLAPVVTSPAILADRIVVGDSERRVFALSLDRGRRIWERTIPEGILLESPVVYGSAVLFSTSGATFRALRGEDGRDLWTRFIGCLTQSSPCVAGGIVYFTAGPNIHAMQCADGDDAWRLTYPGLFSSPICLDGRLHILSMGGVLLSLK